MRLLPATLTFLAACLLIVLITVRLADIPASWHWVGVAA